MGPCALERRAAIGIPLGAIAWPGNTALAACALLALAVAGGCTPGTTRRTPLVASPAALLTEPEVHSFLGYFCSETARVVESATIAVQEEIDDRARRRQLTLWKMRAVADCQRAAADDAAVPAFLGTWVAALQQTHLVAGAGGAALLSEHQPRVASAIGELAALIEGTAPRVIPPDRLPTARTSVHELAAQSAASARAIGSGTLDEGESRLPDIGSMPGFGWARGVALSPFQALEGVDEGAQAATRLASVASRFAALTEQMPRQLRWQMELLLYDVEDRETLAVLRAATVELAASAERISRTAEALPGDLRDALTSALEDVGEAQAGLQPTLRETRAAAEALRSALAALEQATAALDGTLTLIRDWPDAEHDPAAPARRPFDVAEYGAAFEQAGAALAQAREVLEEARSTGASPALAASAAQLDASLRGLVDHVALRVVQVGTLLVVLLAVVLVAARRLTRRAA